MVRGPAVLEGRLQEDFSDWDREKDLRGAHLVRVTPMSSAKPPIGKIRVQTLSNRLDQSGSDTIHALKACDRAKWVFSARSLFCGADASTRAPLPAAVPFWDAALSSRSSRCGCSMASTSLGCCFEILHHHAATSGDLTGLKAPTGL